LQVFGLAWPARFRFGPPPNARLAQPNCARSGRAQRGAQRTGEWPDDGQEVHR
jgi:hypothetical protein